MLAASLSADGLARIYQLSPSYFPEVLDGSHLQALCKVRDWSSSSSSGIRDPAESICGAMR